VRTLRGAPVLVVGLGSIGGETARLMDSFGARVTGIRRRPSSAAAPDAMRVVGPDALVEALADADVVVLSAPQTAETWHLLSDREFAAMKADAVLINVSRGKLVDEAALLRALDGGRLRGAALDVFEHEPLDRASPLWQREDVLITPHVAGFHADHWPEATRLFAENLRRFTSGRPLVNLVDKEAGY
jgi:phosphoglycerate dehydrogenase-like enzyme